MSWRYESFRHYLAAKGVKSKTTTARTSAAEHARFLRGMAELKRDIETDRRKYGPSPRAFRPVIQPQPEVPLKKPLVHVTFTEPPSENIKIRLVETPDEYIKIRVPNSKEEIIAKAREAERLAQQRLQAAGRVVKPVLTEAGAEFKEYGRRVGEFPGFVKEQHALAEEATEIGAQRLAERLREEKAVKAVQAAHAAAEAKAELLVEEAGKGAAGFKLQRLGDKSRELAQEEYNLNQRAKEVMTEIRGQPLSVQEQRLKALSEDYEDLKQRKAALQERTIEVGVAADTKFTPSSDFQERMQAIREGRA